VLKNNTRLHTRARARNTHTHTHTHTYIHIHIRRHITEQDQGRRGRRVGRGPGQQRQALSGMCVCEGGGVEEVCVRRASVCVANIGDTSVK